MILARVDSSDGRSFLLHQLSSIIIGGILHFAEHRSRSQHNQSFSNCSCRYLLHNYNACCNNLQSIDVDYCICLWSSSEVENTIPRCTNSCHLACRKYQSTVASFNEENLDIIRQWSFSRTEVSPDDFHAIQKISIWAFLHHQADLEAQDYHGYIPLAYSLAECPGFFAAKFSWTSTHHPISTQPIFLGILCFTMRRVKVI